MLATSQILIFLFIHWLHVFICFLVDGWPEQKHLQQKSHCFELGKSLSNLCSYHCLLSKSYFKHFESFRSIFLGMPALPVEQHILVLNKTMYTTVSLVQPYSKQWTTRQTLLHVAVGVCGSSSSVMSWSVSDILAQRTVIVSIFLGIITYLRYRDNNKSNTPDVIQCADISELFICFKSMLKKIFLY